MRFGKIRVRLLFFGKLKEYGAAERSLELAEGASIQQLLSSLEDESGVPGALLRSSAVAVNREYASTAAVLREGDEVAILPPVSGGLR
jgi:molybdopterin converting factor subunit 1